jgi:hypothetical protein
VKKKRRKQTIRDVVQEISLEVGGEEIMALSRRTEFGMTAFSAGHCLESRKYWRRKRGDRLNA